MVDQETIYAWLHDKKYEALREFLFRGKDKIKNDVMLSAATKVVELELVRLSNDQENDAEFWHTVEMLHNFHPKHYEMQPDNFKNLTLILANHHKKNLKISIRFAQMFPEDEISKEIIKLHAETETQIIEHERQEYIKITHNPIPINIKASTPLFKSKEEQKLYLALRRVFDTYIVYPNVATSNIISFEAIGAQLTPKEREYFYKSIIDFVVFDQLGGYEPIYFIELDSVWHDLDKIEEKDKTKDRIFSLAGLKLIRIRHMANREIDEKTYLELIEDIRRQL
jgi:hypothetical protein